MSGRRILIIISGGIAAYKTLELIRLCKKAGYLVTPVLTAAAKEFVTPLSVSALAEEKVYADLFDLTDEAEMGHIELSRSADLIVVAPASADLMSKMAHGAASDLASTILLATDTPVMIAPAMNVRMWLHPATQHNLTTLEERGIFVVGPNEGDMACGEYGPGRMAEPAEIFGAIKGHFSDGTLAGKRVLITSGPTHEPIDPVRYIANRSSGLQGTKIAQACVQAGADVTFLTGPAEIAPPGGCRVIEVTTAAQMYAAAMDRLPVDVAILVAAVADYRVADAATQKVKKKSKSTGLKLNFVENKDILAEISARKEGRPKLVIGFAAETQDVIANAIQKRANKGCDWILANDVSPESGVMGGDENSVILVNKDGAQAWPKMDKAEVARMLVERIGKAL